MKRPWLASVGIFLGVAASGGALVLGGLRSGSGAPAGALGPVAPKDRCAVTSLNGAARTQTFTILVPNHPLANRSNLSEVRSCPYPEVRMRFSSGVDLLLDATVDVPAVWVAPAQTWARMAADHPEWSTVGAVRGHPALLADPEKSAATVGGVEFVENAHLLVAVTGNGEISLEDLIAVAESLESQ